MRSTEVLNSSRHNEFSTHKPTPQPNESGHKTSAGAARRAAQLSSVTRSTRTCCSPGGEPAVDEKGRQSRKRKACDWPIDYGQVVRPKPSRGAGVADVQFFASNAARHTLPSVESIQAACGLTSSGAHAALSRLRSPVCCGLMSHATIVRPLVSFGSPPSPAKIAIIGLDCFGFRRESISISSFRAIKIAMPAGICRTVWVRTAEISVK